MEQAAFWLTFLAAATTGLLAGASLDQLIKQLPARHRIGIEAYSAYSQAADLGRGILFYGILGIGSALLAVAAAVVAYVAKMPRAVFVPSGLGAVFAVLHSLTTALAAPTNFSQRRVQGDPAALAKVFNRFTRWHTARTLLQVINFGVLLWAIVALADRMDNKATSDLRDLRKQLITATRTGDRDVLNRLLAEDFLFVHSTGVVQTKAQYIERAVVNAQKGSAVELRFLEKNVRVYDGRVAVVATQSVRHDPTRGEDLHFRGTDVILKRGKGWQWVSVQSTRIPDAN